jgi:hypothetical protein
MSVGEKLKSNLLKMFTLMVLGAFYLGAIETLILKVVRIKMGENFEPSVL